MKTYKVIENHYGRRFFLSYILKSFRRRRREPFFFLLIYHFFSFPWRQSRKKAVPLLSVMCGHIKVQYACKHIRYCVLFWCKLLSSLAVADFEAKHFSGILNLTSVYTLCVLDMCVGGCETEKMRG